MNCDQYNKFRLASRRFSRTSALGAAVFLGMFASSVNANVDLSTVASVYQSNWEVGNTDNWTSSSTLTVKTTDLAGTTIPASLAVGATNGSGTTSAAASAYSGVFVPSADEGSFRLSFVVTFQYRLEDKNRTTISLLSSSGDSYGLYMYYRSAASEGLTVMKNGVAVSNGSASYDWFGDTRVPMKIVFERDGSTNEMRVYASSDLNADPGTANLLLTVTGTTDIGAINQIRIDENVATKQHLYRSITLETNAVPETASLSVLALAGYVFLRRR